MDDGCFLKRRREHRGEGREDKVPSSSLNPIAPFGLTRLGNKGLRILKMEVSALVLACGLRVGADESRGLELMEPIIGPCMSSRSDLSTMPSDFFSILTTPSLWLRDHLTYPGFVNVFVSRLD
ncbi:uncharacterized protein LOC135592784 isoform X2 [Musa acuminata AAA Group]|uniref:uncharacterized protein LOC135592784 isoform X2 n=1 Tax=Musa acuminata AAA Group TaxID=214697 RepID=UPI0031D008D8